MKPRRALRLRINFRKNLPRFDGNAQRPHSVALADGDGCSGDRRMKLKMPVRIDMVERQPGGAKSLELRGDFFRYLPPQRGVHHDLCAETGKVSPQSSVAVDESRYVRTVRDRLAIDENEVKPDTQVR